MRRWQKQFVGIGLAILTLAPPSLSAQEAEGYLYGDGIEYLLNDGEPDESGLIFTIQIPNRGEELWAVTVHNPTNEAVEGVYRNLEYKIDGQWYWINLDADLGFHPYRIEPGGYGFDDAGTLGFNPENFEDVRLSEPDEPRDDDFIIVDLEIADLDEESDGGYSGTVTNPSEYTLTNVGVSFACVDRDGFITDAFYNGVDIFRLGAGKSEPFEFSDANGECSSGSEVIAAAAGRYEP